MALGDGIRRNIAHVSQEERDRFRDAVLELNQRFYPGHPTDAIPGGVSLWFKEDEIHQATHYHGGPNFLPWHRELMNRFEAKLREVDPELSLHYWDWTTDPRSSPDGAGGTVNLLSAAFLGSASGQAGQPLLGAGFYDPNANPSRADGPAYPPLSLSRNLGSGAPNVAADASIIAAAEGLPQADQWPAFRAVLEGNHDTAHGYFGPGSTLTNPHISFQDPFVFLLHSNVDRLFAMWQAQPGAAWRLDPDQVYGSEMNTTGQNGIATPLEPWADEDPGFPQVRPWAPPENQQASKNHRHPSVVKPPCYDTLPLSAELSKPSAGAPLAFVDIPEGRSTVRAAVFELRACRPLTLEIIDGPGPGFGTPLGILAIQGGPHAFVTPGYVWIQYTGTSAGDSATGSVTIRCAETAEEWVIPITANTVAKPSVASVLVLDKSGSMAWNSGITDYPRRVDLLRFAAPHFVELLDDDDGIGIASFDHTAQAVMGVQAAGDLVFGAGRAAAKQHVQSSAIDPGGATSIGAGIDVAHGIASSANTFAERALVVFTDGFENASPFIADVAGMLDARVYAIGLGTAEYLNPVALEALTSSTGGHLLLTGELDVDQQFRLSKYFLQIVAGITNAEIIVDPVSSGLPGQEHRIPFDVTEADYHSDVILLSPAPQVFDFALETPDGTVVAENAGLPGLALARGEGIHFYRLNLPLALGDAEAHAGRWHAILSPSRDAFERHLVTLRRQERIHVLERVSAHGVPYSLNAHARSNLTLHVGVHADSREPGATVLMRARLREYGLPIDGRNEVAVGLVRPDGTETTIALYEVDGGVFEGTLAAHMTGIYALHFRAKGTTRRGVPFTREALRTAAVWPGGNAPAPSRHTDPRARDEELCRLLGCLLGDGALEAYLARLGVEPRVLRRCIDRLCAERTRPPAF